MRKYLLLTLSIVLIALFFVALILLAGLYFNLPLVTPVAHRVAEGIVSGTQGLFHWVKIGVPWLVHWLLILIYVLLAVLIVCLVIGAWIIFGTAAARRRKRLGPKPKKVKPAAPAAGAPHPAPDPAHPDPVHTDPHKDPKAKGHDDHDHDHGHGHKKTKLQEFIGLLKDLGSLLFLTFVLGAIVALLIWASFHGRIDHLQQRPVGTHPTEYRVTNTPTPAPVSEYITVHAPGSNHGWSTPKIHVPRGKKLHVCAYTDGDLPGKACGGGYRARNTLADGTEQIITPGYASDLLYDVDFQSQDPETEKVIGYRFKDE